MRAPRERSSPWFGLSAGGVAGLVIAGFAVLPRVLHPAEWDFVVELLAPAMPVALQVAGQLGLAQSVIAIVAATMASFGALWLARDALDPRGDARAAVRWVVASPRPWIWMAATFALVPLGLPMGNTAGGVLALVTLLAICLPLVLWRPGVVDGLRVGPPGWSWPGIRAVGLVLALNAVSLAIGLMAEHAGALIDAGWSLFATATLVLQARWWLGAMHGELPSLRGFAWRPALFLTFGWWLLGGALLVATMPTTAFVIRGLPSVLHAAQVLDTPLPVSAHVGRWLLEIGEMTLLPSLALHAAALLAVARLADADRRRR